MCTLGDVAQMSDKQLVTALDAAISVIDPMLDVLAGADPLGLKPHTFDSGDEHTSPIARAGHVAAGVLDVADWPGTQGWTQRSMNERADWWISRLGTVNTVAVAYPGVFGAWTRFFPLSTSLGFANQAVMLIAIAREYGVTDRDEQIRLLASVLCRRELPDDLTAAAPPHAPRHQTRSVVRSLWDVAQILRRADNEMGRRPQATPPFSMLTWIPVLGAPTLYVGERLALCRAARTGRAWIAAHPDAITVSRPLPA